MSSSSSPWVPFSANNSNNTTYDEEAILLHPEDNSNRPSISDGIDHPSTPYIPSFSSTAGQGRQSPFDEAYGSDGNDRKPAPYSTSSRQRNQSELGRADSEIYLNHPDSKKQRDNHRNPTSFGAAPDYAYLPNTIESDAEYARRLYEDELSAVREQKSRRGAKAVTPPIDDEVLLSNLEKAVRNPKVVRQMEKRYAGSHRPYFTWIISAANVVLLIASLIMNYTLTDRAFEDPSRNPMIGPSNNVLVHMGARFVPCMRTVPFIDSTTPVPCPNSTDPTQQLCTIDQLCGFGGFPPNQPNQWFRFFTPIFLHGGIVHLILNLIFQWTTCMELEKDTGTIRFGLIYMISGVGGLIFGANFAPLKSISIGASGGLYGILGCLLLDVLQNWKIIEKPITALCKMLAVILISFALGLLPGFDNFAHIGGFISGLIAGIILLPRINYGKWDRRLKIGSMLAAIPLLVVIFIYLLMNFYDTGRDPAEACPWCKYLNCLPINGWCDAF